MFAQFPIILSISFSFLCFPQPIHFIQQIADKTFFQPLPSRHNKKRVFLQIMSCCVFFFYYNGPTKREQEASEQEISKSFLHTLNKNEIIYFHKATTSKKEENKTNVILYRINIIFSWNYKYTSTLTLIVSLEPNSSFVIVFQIPTIDATIVKVFTKDKNTKTTQKYLKINCHNKLFIV